MLSVTIVQLLKISFPSELILEMLLVHQIGS